MAVFPRQYSVSRAITGRLSRILVPGICVLLLLLIDVYLYRSGASWTLIHYESLLPLASTSIPNRTRAWVSVGLTALVGASLILYFEFGLPLRLVLHSYIATGLIIVASTLIGFEFARTFFLNRVVPMLFVTAFLLCLLVDKGMTRDQFASSFAPHFVELGSKNTKISISNNVVYRMAASGLQQKHGTFLVIFESLGVLNDDTVLQRVLRRHPAFRSSDIRHEGGSTLLAEYRFLCGSNNGILDSAHCLPALAEDSAAFHGNSLTYFNRNEIYRQMGFKLAYGARELSELPQCAYAYRAVCDDALLNEAVRHVMSTRCRGFTYALTIDSHFPYAKYAGKAAEMYEDLDRALVALGNVVASLPNCDVILTGDHPPPLSSDFKRGSVLMLRSGG